MLLPVMKVTIWIHVLFCLKLSWSPLLIKRYLCFMYFGTHIIMDFKLVYPILANLNRLCVNFVLIVNLKVNKYEKTNILPVDSCHGTIIVTSDCTIVISGHNGSVRTTFVSNNSIILQNNSITQNTCNGKYTWLPFLLLPPSGYSIWGTENCKPETPSVPCPLSNVISPFLCGNKWLFPKTDWM